MRYVQFHPNLDMLIDDDDYEKIKGLKIQKHTTSGNRIYACVRNSDYSRTYLHRLIMNAPDGMEVDHINGDTLDDRRCNLRICTRSQNMANSSKRKHSNQPYKGIKQSQSGKWFARLTSNKKVYNSKPLDTPEEAARAYDKMAREHHKEFARTNWPEAE